LLSKTEQLGADREAARQRQKNGFNSASPLSWGLSCCQQEQNGKTG